MYRTSSAVTSEIVLHRRSRSRVGTKALLVVAMLVAGPLLFAMAAARKFDPAVARSGALVMATVFAGALLVRTRSLRVTRVGRELRIRSGRRESAVLVSEVLEIDIDTVGAKAHTVVFVLRDGRRLPVGEPHELMARALADRRVLREALLR